MSGPLLTAAELAAVQDVAISGMQTPVTILRRVSVDTDYGDQDELTFSVVMGVKGWLHSTPTAVQESDSGSVVTVNTYRLFVPVGTDIRDGDRVTAGIDTYTVTDTTRESTWKALLACSLRKRE